MNLKLGRKHPTRAKLKLAKYVGHALPPPPVSCDWTMAMSQDWGMMGNDRLGDCTCAAMGHAVQVITCNGDGLVTPSDALIVQMYEQSGYNPADPSTDQGWTETAAMAFMCDTGLAAVKLDAFADVDQTVQREVMQAVALFGGCYIGVQITQADIDAFNAHQPWTSTDMSNVLGGHALWLPSYFSNGIKVITWGQPQMASWDWFASHCDEAHACLFFPWVRNSVNCDPDGFDLATLNEDLKQV
jgi:hypothetical protein